LKHSISTFVDLLTVSRLENYLFFVDLSTVEEGDVAGRKEGKRKGLKAVVMRLTFPSVSVPKAFSV